MFANTTGVSGSIKHDDCTHKFTAKEIRAFAGQIWDRSLWQRGIPDRAVLRRYAALLRCAAGQGHKQAGKHSWRLLRRLYLRHRESELWRVEYTPFLCSDSYMTFDGGWYAIPCSNVEAESGGRGGWTCNTYGVIDSIWILYRGPVRGYSACSSTEKEQSEVAHRIYSMHGTSAWTPFE